MIAGYVMSRQDEKTVISRLQAKLKAQQKTIDVLMDDAERRTTEDSGPSSMQLLARNLNLERIIQQKTESLKQQGEQLKLAQMRLLHAQKLESVGQLAAGIAHEINTPAQYISSNIDFIEESFVDVRRLIAALQRVVQAIDQGQAVDEMGRQAGNLLEELDWQFLNVEIPTAVSQSKEGIRRITTIVRAMKEFSHPSAKEKERVAVNPIIETAVLIARNEWKYVSNVTTDLAADLPLVPCYADELGQVILNLLLNAAQAIEEKLGRNRDGEKEDIHITTRSVDSLVEIRIMDTGPGIPVAIRSRIFDPFFTTKEVGRGTGQGLAICHDVITEKHGGTLGFETEEGKGSTFIIRLPLES